MEKEFNEAVTIIANSNRSHFLINKHDLRVVPLKSAEYQEIVKNDFPPDSGYGKQADYFLVFGLSSIQSLWLRQLFATKTKIKSEFKQLAKLSVDNPAEFKRFLKKANLEEEYASFRWNYIALALASNLLEMDIFVEEAREEHYKSIREKAQKIADKNFEETFPDSALFYHDSLPDNKFHFTMLGNSGQVYGISFYLEADYNLTYYHTLLNRKENLSLVCGTMGRTASIYFDYKCPDTSDVPHYEERGNNAPLIRGNDFSAIVINQGNTVFNCFSLPLAILLEAYLDEAYEVLCSAQSKADKEGYLDLSTTYIVYSDYKAKGKTAFYHHPKRDLHKNAMHALSLFGYGAISNFGKQMEGEYSFSATVIAGNKDSDHPDDIRFTTGFYVFLLASEDDGKVIYHGTWTRKEGQRFATSMKEHLSKQLDGIDAPEIVLVNTAIEYLFAEEIFQRAIREGKTKVVFDPDAELCSDEAMDAFLDSIQNKELSEA